MRFTSAGAPICRSADKSVIADRDEAEMAKILGIAVVLVATSAAACNLKTSTLSPTAPTSGGSPGTSTGSLTGTWSSQAFTIPTASSCGNFQWNVTNQVASSLAGTFSATCADGIGITGEASGQLINSTSASITVKGTAVGVPVISTCDFNLSGTGTLSDNSTSLSVPYTGTTCLGPVHGTEVLHKNAPAPAPPASPPAPVPPQPSGPSDAIDLSQAAVYNSPPDIANWPITGAISSVQFAPGPSGVSFQFGQQNSWPDYTPPGWNGPLQYTVWALVNINGRWDTSGFIQMWRGRPGTGAGITVNNDFSRNWAYDGRWGPMNGYQPRVGEQMGFFLSAGNARGDTTVTSVQERTNVVMVTLPPGDNSLFAFALGRMRLP
jgi:hypothetical protein